MALDNTDLAMFKTIRDALVRIGDELHTLNESRNKKPENANLT